MTQIERVVVKWPEWSRHFPKGCVECGNAALTSTVYRLPAATDADFVLFSQRFPRLGAQGGSSTSGP